jgi:hypothetical protein
LCETVDIGAYGKELNETASGDPFFKLKWLKRKTTTEPDLVDGLEALALLMMKKLGRSSQQRETDLFGNPKSGRLLGNHLGEAISSMLAQRLFSLCKVLWRHI